MDAAVVGLIGAAVGAISAIGGSVITTAIQGRTERLGFQRARKADAYGHAVEILFRAAARRSELTASGKPVLSTEDQRQWFLDLAAGLESLTIAVAYAGKDWRYELIVVLQNYGIAVTDLVQKGLSLGNLPSRFLGLKAFEEDLESRRWSGDVMDILWMAASRVSEIAYLDLSGSSSRHAVGDSLKRAPSPRP